MITSIRYRGFSFYYKDNDNKYKEILMKYWPIILKQ
ncbi:lipopolysaccharide core heptose(II) kinase RfaY [Escherichia coli]